MDPDVKDDLNRKAKASDPLPQLITNAYYLLGEDWLETKKAWEKAGHKIPPVMITVANRTETSARIKYSFDHHQILIKELFVGLIKLFNSSHIVFFPSAGIRKHFSLFLE